MSESGLPANPNTEIDEEAQTPDSKRSSISTKPEASDERPTVSSWDGPDDPENPRNWSYFWRVYGVVIPAWYSLTITFGTSVFAPGISDVEKRFHVSREAATLGVSIYAVGLALGPVLGAPISETFGRRPVYLITMPISLLFIMGAGLAQNFGTLLICRLLGSTFGSPGLAIGAGSMADLWNMQKAGTIAATFFILMPFLGSSIGPLIGGYAVEKQNDWRWAMWVMIIISGPAWIASFFQPETYAKQLLKRRAVKRGLPQPPKPPAKEAIKMLLVVTLLRPVHMLLFEPIVGWMSLYVAFAFGMLFGFFDAFPLVFGTIYHFSLGQIGLAYLGIIVGILLATATYITIHKTVYARSMAQITEPGKIPPPEERLYAGMMGSVAIPISLFWFGWTSRASVHWIVPILSGVPFGWGLILIFYSVSSYLVDSYQALNAASAIAANGILRYTFAAAFPLFTLQMYNTLGVDWASSLLGFISLALMPIPWVFYKWGPRLRTRSAYEMGNFS